MVTTVSQDVEPLIKGRSRSWNPVERDCTKQKTKSFAGATHPALGTGVRGREGMRPGDDFSHDWVNPQYKNSIGVYKVNLRFALW